MTISHEQVGDVLVLSPTGQLNSTNSVAVESVVLGHVNGGANKLVLDFDKLDYISSAGLRVVLVLAKRLKQTGGKLVLAGLQPHIREVFDVSGFLAILTVAANREEALAKF